MGRIWGECLITNILIILIDKGEKITVFIGGNTSFKKTRPPLLVFETKLLEKQVLTAILTWKN